MIAQSLRRALVGTLADDFSDPTNERIIYLCAAGLAIVGVALLVGTLLWWRRGRQEHPALAPLEVMGRRAWVKAPEGDRRRRLEHVRLAGAGGSVDEPVAAEPLDLQALVRSVPQAFDDLREPSAVIALGPVPEEPVVEEVADSESVEGEEPASVQAEVPAVEESVKQAAPDAATPEVDATMLSTERPVEAHASRPTESST